MIEVVGAECSGIAGKFSKAANVGAVIDLVWLAIIEYILMVPRRSYGVFSSFMCRPISKCVYDIFKRPVESLRKVKGIVEQPIRELSVVCSDLVDADSKSSQSAIEHQDDLCTIAACSWVVGV